MNVERLRLNPFFVRSSFQTPALTVRLPPALRS